MDEHYGNVQGCAQMTLRPMATLALETLALVLCAVILQRSVLLLVVRILLHPGAAPNQLSPTIVHS